MLGKYEFIYLGNLTSEGPNQVLTITMGYCQIAVTINKLNGVRLLSRE